MSANADRIGQPAPTTEITKFTVTGTPQPMMLTSGAGSFSVVPGVFTLGQQTAVLLNGAVGPVSVGAPTVYYCSVIWFRCWLDVYYGFGWYGGRGSG